MIELGNADLDDTSTWVPTTVEPGNTPLPGLEHAANLPPRPAGGAGEMPDELNVDIAPPIAPRRAA